MTNRWCITHLSADARWHHGYPYYPYTLRLPRLQASTWVNHQYNVR